MPLPDSRHVLTGPNAPESAVFRQVPSPVVSIFRNRRRNRS